MHQPSVIVSQPAPASLRQASPVRAWVCARALAPPYLLELRDAPDTSYRVTTCAVGAKAPFTGNWGLRPGCRLCSLLLVWHFFQAFSSRRAKKSVCVTNLYIYTYLQIFPHTAVCIRLTTSPYSPTSPSRGLFCPPLLAYLQIHTPQDSEELAPTICSSHLLTICNWFACFLIVEL